MKTFMRAMEDEGETEVFVLFEFDGWTFAPHKPDHRIVRVTAGVEDGKYGLWYIYKEVGT